MSLFNDSKEISNDPDRLNLFIVSIVACVVISLETVSFQAISYVNDYLAAMQVISVALLGIALGGLLSYFFSNREALAQILFPLLTLLPLTVLASFPVIVFLSPEPVVMMALLTLPYTVASLVIATMFNRLKPNRVYLFDLAGAGAGAVLTVIIIPHLREEGSFILLSAIAAVPLLLLAASLRRKRAARGFLTAAILLLLGSGVLLTAHVAKDPFNMARHAVIDAQKYKYKIFRAVQSGSHEILYSRGSLVERIDILKRKTNKDRLNSCYNGRWVDVITPRRVKSHGALDNRLPTRLKLGENPDTLLVGPSGQGLTKAVQTLGDGHIDAVEINGAIAGLMTKELKKRSGGAYDRMDLTIGDVRSFLARTKRKYDVITLLNTHRVNNIGDVGAPEYCHTKEAAAAYLDHLKKDGFIVFEEIDTTEQATLTVKRFLRTVIATMRQRGIEDPEKNIAVWQLWHGCEAKDWDKDRCGSKGRFTFLLVKNDPITDKEYAHLKEWQKMLAARSSSKDRGRGIKWRYFPQENMTGEWPDAIHAGSIGDLTGVDETRHNMSLITDDKPFAYDVYKARAPQWAVFRNVAFLAFLMVLLPALATFAARTRAARQKAHVVDGGRNLLFVLYFAVLGVGYLLVEIVLMQKLAIFLDSPVKTLVIVLGTLLISSGIGGHFSQRLSKRTAAAAMLAVTLLTVLAGAVLGPLLNALMFLPFAARVAVAVALVALPGFFMGIPFPYAMSLSKERLSPEHAGLLFGINGAMGAMASPLALILSLVVGFEATMLVGGAAYMISMLLLFMIEAKMRVSRRAALPDDRAYYSSSVKGTA